MVDYIKLKLARSYFDVGMVDQGIIQCRNFFIEVAFFGGLREEAEGGVALIEMAIAISEIDPTQIIFERVIGSDDKSERIAETLGYLAFDGRFPIVAEYLDKAMTTNPPMDWRPFFITAGKSEYLKDELSASMNRDVGKVFRKILESPDDITVNLQSEITQYSGAITRHSLHDEISLVAEFLNERVYKIAYSIKSTGTSVRLMLREGTPLQSRRRDLFDNIDPWSNLPQLAQMIRSSRSLAYHCFASTYGNYVGSFAALLFSGNRAVCDFYDVFDPSVAPSRFAGNSEISQTNKILYKFQRAVYDNSRGICTRLLYPKLTKSKLKDFEQLRIYLPEFCWGNIPTAKKLSDLDGKLRVVHGGTFLPESKSGQDHTGFLWLAKKAEILDIYFHLYSSNDEKLDLSDYEAISVESDRFSLHKKTEPQDFVGEIEKYDVGIGINYPRTIAERAKISATQDPSGTWASKCSDYIDAGLYVLWNWRATATNFILERYKVGEPMEIDEFQEIEFWDRVRDRVLHGGVDFTRAREALDMKKHGQRLITFYNEVASTGR